MRTNISAAAGIAAEERPGPNADRIEDSARLLESVVAPAFGVTPGMLRKAGRGCAKVAFARQVAIYLAHTRLGLSYAEAGDCFRRERTTAAHACRQVEERREDLRLDTFLDCLERSIDLMPAPLAESRAGP